MSSRCVTKDLRPPKARFFEHWDRFNRLASERQIKSAVEGVWAIGYMPPCGRFVLCAGDIQAFPFLYQASRRYAMSHGLAIERAGVERYLPHPDDSELHPVDAGYRIRDEAGPARTSPT